MLSIMLSTKVSNYSLIFFKTSSATSLTILSLGLASLLFLLVNITNIIGLSCPFG